MGRIFPAPSQRRSRQSPESCPLRTVPAGATPFTHWPETQTFGLQVAPELGQSLSALHSGTSPPVPPVPGSPPPPPEPPKPPALALLLLLLLLLALDAPPPPGPP